MGLYFIITSGPLDGKRFKVIPGMKIGRKEADITINDRRISTAHAEVQFAGSDKPLVLIDLNSRNGIKQQGQRVPQVSLAPGTIFEISGSKFEVIELVDEGVNAEPFAPADMEEWRLTLFKLASKPLLHQKTPLETGPFHPPVEFIFLDGPQMNEHFLLGYGPRRAGPKSLDLPILDPLAPEKCFEVLPEGGRARFKSLDEKVLLNDRTTSSEILKTGDIISLGGTRILVRLK